MFVDDRDDNEDENAHHSDAAVMLVQIVQRHYSAHGLHRTSRQGTPALAENAIWRSITSYTSRV